MGGHVHFARRRGASPCTALRAQVARTWLDSGDIVLIADSEGVRDTYEADGSALEPAAPLTVLVNRGTASASEVRSRV